MIFCYYCFLLILCLIMVPGFQDIRHQVTKIISFFILPLSSGPRSPLWASLSWWLAFIDLTGAPSESLSRLHGLWARLRAPVSLTGSLGLPGLLVPPCCPAWNKSCEAVSSSQCT